MNKCPSCNLPLFISKSQFKSDLDSTEVYVEQTQVCTNPKCSFYSGKDLNNPLKTVRVIKNKIN